LSSWLRRSRRPFSWDFSWRDRFGGARIQAPACPGSGKGSQGRAPPARRGGLYCPKFGCCRPRWRRTAVRRSWSPFRGRTQRTSPLLQRTARAFRFGCPDIPSFRKGAWCVSATAKWAHSVRRPRPKWGAHVDRRARSVAVSESFSSPPLQDSGSRHREGRSRRG
jgi:hypothetical protein